MGFFSNLDNLSRTLLLSIALLGAASIFLFALKKYEIAIALMLLSSWVHWLFQTNTEQSLEEMMSTGSGTYIRISIVALAGLIGIFQFLKLRSGEHRKIPFYIILLEIFLAFALSSTVYSIDKRYTFVRSMEFIFFFSFLLGLFLWLNSGQRLRKLFNIYFWVMVFGVILNIIALAALRERAWSWEMPDRLQGLTEHPNTLGALCMLTYPALIWKYSQLNRFFRFWIVILFCAVLFIHILSGSRSSLTASFLSFFAAVLISGRAKSLPYLIKVSAFMVISFFAVYFLFESRPSSFIRGDAPISTATGRVELWRGCVELIKEKPVLGYGYGVAGKVWSDPRFYRSGNFLWAGTAKASLHNGYLSVLVGLGIAGLLLCLSVLLIPVWSLRNLESCSYKTFVICIVVQAAVINFFESSLASGSQMLSSLVLWMFVIAAGKLAMLLSQDKENIKVLPCSVNWSAEYAIG